ncbi:MAG: phosphotransferase [Bacteroidota bacterium]|nr:phosphotransferase [Bacteroidota bacterium]
MTAAWEHPSLSALRSEDLGWLAQAFTAAFSEEAREMTLLKGDASDRRLLRLRGASRSAIGVVGPSAEENRAFIGFARAFRRAGLPVPEIYATDDHDRCYLEEDLGDTTLAAWLESHRDAERLDDEALAMYRRVLDQLLRFQIDAADVVDYGLCYQTVEFAGEAMRFDLAYFRDMFLVPLVRLPWQEAAFRGDGEKLVSMLLQAERRFFLYRDFQSRNIMIRDGHPYFIDFQSGRRGALQYDVAALLFDSKGRLPAHVRTQLLAHYCEGVAARIAIDRDRFLRLFDGFAVLRLMQALGAFGNLGLNKNKPSFLALIPSRLRSLGSLVARAEIMTELPSLRSLLLGICEDPDALTLSLTES